jgi:hypothetical protein
MYIYTYVHVEMDDSSSGRQNASTTKPPTITENHENNVYSV